MFKTGIALGFAAGYVFGTKAGRERYQQITEAARAFSQNPGVQKFTDEVNKTVSLGKDRATTAASSTVEKAGTTLADQATKAKDFVGSKTGGTSGGSNADTVTSTPTTTPSTIPTPSTVNTGNTGTSSTTSTAPTTTGGRNTARNADDPLSAKDPLDKTNITGPKSKNLP